MAPKHVRFSDELVREELHVPVASGSSRREKTPSPTWSDTSLPESSAPYTPPSSLPNVPLPATPITLNPLLTNTVHGSLLQWDVTYGSSTAKVISPKRVLRHLTAEELAEPATSPSLPYLEIHLNNLPWWKPIQIAASSRSHPYVTVGQLLDTTNRYLRTPVPEREFAVISSSQSGMGQKMSVAFHGRCKKFADHARREEERNKGLKRVDCLLECTRFLGLAPLGKGGDPRFWRLLLGPQLPS